MNGPNEDGSDNTWHRLAEEETTATEHNGEDTGVQDAVGDDGDSQGEKATTTSKRGYKLKLPENVPDDCVRHLSWSSKRARMEELLEDEEVKKEVKRRKEKLLGIDPDAAAQKVVDTAASAAGDAVGKDDDSSPTSVAVGQLDGTEFVNEIIGGAEV